MADSYSVTCSAFTVTVFSSLGVLILAVVVPVSLPGWRAADRHAFFESGGYVEVRQGYGLQFYTLTMKQVGSGATIRCESHLVEWDLPGDASARHSGRQELQECSGKHNENCECVSSYKFLIRQSTAKGDDKAAAVWRDLRTAGLFTYIAIGGVLSLLTVAGCGFWASASERPVFHKPPFPDDAIGSGFHTAAFCFSIVAFAVWLTLTDYDLCFDEGNRSMNGASCPLGLPAYFMICASGLFLGVAVVWQWWSVAACRRLATPRVTVSAPSGRQSATLPLPVQVVGKASNPQDDTITVTTSATIAGSV
ncbi:unnamed protein product [Vitrella brassicaformis CCMP3155]|uniref:Uncharacterized protein n=1 Tax=Vitrella brassicaformis (strain CCMP3155) TaxID=1169540 RepID=A0A0G4G5W0_VITBC|nr:unnamed protein product [Vitrella brassicaformis CCMP3155]|eukprot:CEM23908.1 unnamed protein product [Vitrella brassicaformis CCMP3155]